MNLRTLLELGRVSNLPTVCSNAVAGMVLAGGEPSAVTVSMVSAVAGLLYVGGMYLNDAFDAEIDAQQRPERPIPSGRIARGTVFTAGFGLLAAAIILVAAWSVLRGQGFAALGAAVATAGMIVVYDRWHKGNPAGPVVMGLCRVGVYAIAALATTASPHPRVWFGALLLLGYVLGLTYVAKYENRGSLARRWPLLGLFAPLVAMLPLLREPWIARSIFVGFGMWLNRGLDHIKRGKIPAAVGSMIAGISLLDAMLIARYGTMQWSLFAIAAFFATVALQRRIAGT